MRAAGRRWWTALALLLVAAAAAAQSAPEAARQRELERDAAAYLSLARKAIQEEGFSNARVALNVWKASALDAGNFDPKTYEDLKRQLYEKSVRDNLRCVESAIAHRDIPNANTCLKIYRLHATEIGAFDPRRHEELKNRIGAIRRREK